MEERVAYIESLMSQEVWDDETSKELQLMLAKAWGLASDSVGCSAVRMYSAEAGRNLHGAARAKAGEYATLALQSLAYVAKNARSSPLPGDKNAAVNASEKLLRFAGLAEPEEDKQKPAQTVVLIGQTGTSPAMRAVFGAPVPKELNGKGSVHPEANGTAQGADAVPAGDRRGGVVPPRNG